MATTELVPSVSVENLVNQRAAVIERLQEAVLLIREASKIAGAAHLGMPRFEVTTSYGNRGTSIAEARTNPSRDGNCLQHDARDLEDISKVIRLGVDCGGWQYLMHESGLRTLMDSDARKKWDSAITEGDVPELTGPNVRSTFQMLHDGRADMFERGVIECFRRLSWDYKTNLPQKFGKRIVLTYLRGKVTPGKYSTGTCLGYVNYERCNTLDDLSRVFTVLDGKPEPDHRQGWYGRVAACNRTTDPDAQDAYIAVKSYRNGNGHATFLRPDLVERMNRILAKHFPNALPEPK